MTTSYVHLDGLSPCIYSNSVGEPDLVSHDSLNSEEKTHAIDELCDTDFPDTSLFAHRSVTDLDSPRFNHVCTPSSSQIQHSFAHVHAPPVQQHVSKHHISVLDGAVTRVGISCLSDFAGADIRGISLRNLRVLSEHTEIAGDHLEAMAGRATALR